MQLLPGNNQNTQQVQSNKHKHLPMTFIGEMKSNMTLEKWNISPHNESSSFPRADSKERGVTYRQTERGGGEITIIEAVDVDGMNIID